MYKFYSEHINTTSTLYINKVKANDFEKNTRKYSSSLEMNLYNDNIDKGLYELLISVTNKNVISLQKYYKLKSKLIGINKLHIYDTQRRQVPPETLCISRHTCSRAAWCANYQAGRRYLNNWRRYWCSSRKCS